MESVERLICDASIALVMPYSVIRADNLLNRFAFMPVLANINDHKILIPMQ